MNRFALPRMVAIIAAPLLGLASLASPASAAAAPRARLVHCDTGTCLRIAGIRQNATSTVSIGGRTMAVTGGRAWRAELPLAVARDLASASGGTLRYAVGTAGGVAPAEGEVLLPPGALGRHVELAVLMVSAH